MTLSNHNTPFRVLLTISVAILFCVLAWQFLQQSNAVMAIKAKSNTMLVSAAQSGAVNAPAAVAPATFDRAIHARPLDVATVNAGVYAKAIGRPKPYQMQASDVAVLQAMGWRYTPALQNLAVAAIASQDVTQLIGISDALLRREELVREATLLINAAEIFPQGQAVIVEKLKLEPLWRTPYLKAVADLRQPQQVVARARLLEMLGATDTPATVEEIAPALKLLVDNQRVPLAYRLWSTSLRVKPAKIQDGNFAAAYSRQSAGLEERETLPFEWSFPSGSGFWSELVSAGGKRQELMIHWDGRGVPVFASQQLWLQSGVRSMVIEGSDLNSATFSRLGFSLRCPQGSVRLVRQGAATAKKATFVIDQEPACDGPVFEMNGLPKDYNSGFDRFRTSGGEEIVFTIGSIRLQ